MRLYLSSFREGNFTEELKQLAAPGTLVAVSVNALDNQSPDVRQRIFERERSAMVGLGYIVEELDLREFFESGGGPTADLKSRLNKYSLTWFSGGNAFILMLAIRLSGFDAAIRNLLEKNAIAYGGYSAGAVVAGVSLKGIDLVDRTDDFPKDYPSSEIHHEGLGFVPYVIVPHYKSNHPESPMMEKVVSHLTKLGLPYKTLRDGDVDIHR